MSRHVESDLPWPGQKIFRPPVKQAETPPLIFKKIMEKKPSWPSFNAQSSHAMSAEMVMMLQAHRTGDWSTGKD
eukprot:9511497-Prorocentrum_lima.AAC.1